MCVAAAAVCVLGGLGAVAVYVHFPMTFEVCTRLPSGAWSAPVPIAASDVRRMRMGAEHGYEWVLYDWTNFLYSGVATNQRPYLRFGASR